jgi:hypothetical protein
MSYTLLPADIWRLSPLITSQRQEILQLLERLSELTPDARFGQLVANLCYLAVGPTNEAIWDMEDEQLAAAIRKHIAELSDRGANVGG